MGAFPPWYQMVASCFEYLVDFNGFIAHSVVEILAKS